MDTVRALAQKAMDKQKGVKEEVKSSKINRDKIRELVGKSKPAEPEVDEARIITPNSLVNVFYKPKQGTRVVQVARSVPADKAKRVIDTYVHRHATTPGMSRIYPSDFEMQVSERRKKSGIFHS